jgi:hypothetical protein
MQAARVFPGRVIFDHLPKTAGTAINAWLRTGLGNGCVTTNLIGNHRELISRYGGNYSVISAHVAFYGEGLDPRYQYVTCLREPIDRALSWLYFVLGHDEHALPIWAAARHFVASEGEGQVNAIGHHICNPYVEHFAAIDASVAASDAEKLARALATIERYDLWGFQEALPEFVDDFAALLGLQAPADVARVNVTRERPAVDAISASFRQRLEELNALDLEFYRILRGRYEKARRQWQRQRPAVAAPGWVPFDQQRGERIFDTPEFALLSVKLEGENQCTVGSVLSFLLEFSLAVPVAELEIGIHIFDQDGRWAFGTNTTLLDQALSNRQAGTYREHWAVAAELPEGDYTAGFAFAERLEGGTREIAWYDKLLDFRITRRIETQSAGYVSLPAAVDCRRISDRIVQPVMDAQGTLRSAAVFGDLIPGECLSLPVDLTNTSAQDWVSLVVHPINLSYRWLDEQGHVTVAEGERTPLPSGVLCAGAGVAMALSVRAPDYPGRYRLRAMPVQELVCWFDERGFRPLEIDMTVVATGQVRHFPAQDVRLASLVGHTDKLGQRISDGRAGYLLFGPYVKLSGGNWRAVFSGSFDTQGGSIRADVVAEKGTRCFAQGEVEGSCSTLCLDFVLDTPVEDLEARLWVDAGAIVCINEVCLEPRQQKAEPPVKRKRSNKISAKDRK